MEKNNASLETRDEFLKNSNEFIAGMDRTLSVLQHSDNNQKVENIGKICQEKILKIAEYFENYGIDFFDPENTLSMSIINYLFLKNTVEYSAQFVSELERKRHLYSFLALFSSNNILLKKYNQKCKEINSFSIEKNIVEVLFMYYSYVPGTYRLYWDTHKEMLINLGYESIIEDVDDNLLELSLGFEGSFVEANNMEEYLRTINKRG